MILYECILIRIFTFHIHFLEDLNILNIQMHTILIYITDLIRDINASDGRNQLHSFSENGVQCEPPKWSPSCRFASHASDEFSTNDAATFHMITRASSFII